jgi:hypothetical protein
MWGRNIPQSASGGKIIVSKGAVGLYEFKWNVGTYDDPDTEIVVSQATDMKTGQHEGEPKLTEPGNYTLDMYVGNDKFFTFPFKVFTADSFIYLDGAWNDWAYLFYPDGDTGRELTWKMFLRNVSATEEQKIVRVSVEIVRDKDKKLICSAMPTGMTKTLFREWNRFEFKLINPPGHPSGEEFTRATHLLEMDGSYTLTAKIDGQLYGVWKFNVKGGKLEYAGRALQSKADPLTLILGAPGTYWYEKNK